MATILPTLGKAQSECRFFRNLTKDGQISQADITMRNLYGGKKVNGGRYWPYQA